MQIVSRILDLRIKRRWSIIGLSAFFFCHIDCTHSFLRIALYRVFGLSYILLHQCAAKLSRLNEKILFVYTNSCMVERRGKSTHLIGRVIRNLTLFPALEQRLFLHATFSFVSSAFAKIVLMLMVLTSMMFTAVCSTCRIRVCI